MENYETHVNELEKIIRSSEFAISSEIIKDVFNNIIDPLLRAVIDSHAYVATQIEAENMALTDTEMSHDQKTQHLMIAVPDNARKDIESVQQDLAMLAIKLPSWLQRAVNENLSCISY